MFSFAVVLLLPLAVFVLLSLVVLVGRINSACPNERRRALEAMLSSSKRAYEPCALMKYAMENICVLILCLSDTGGDGEK